VEASSGSPFAHINERMIADALIEAGLVTGSRLVERDWAIRDVNCRMTGYSEVIHIIDKRKRTTTTEYFGLRR
jgi:hypothetical protein